MTRPTWAVSATTTGEYASGTGYGNSVTAAYGSSVTAAQFVGDASANKIAGAMVAGGAAAAAFFL